jgi:hypothetical protein
MGTRRAPTDGHWHPASSPIRARSPSRTRSVLRVRGSNRADDTSDHRIQAARK